LEVRVGARTALYPQHLNAHAKIVDFGGWDMPLHYGSQLEEHLLVRRSAGMFDVSHMTIVDVDGPQARDFLRYLLANDIDRLQDVGKALYSAMLNEQGGVLDDLIVYRMPEGYRVVVNCATREKDLAWMNQMSARFEVGLTERPDLAMIAVQGPEAIARTGQARPEASGLIAELKVFSGRTLGQWMFCRTGYTGEDGLEIMLPEAEAGALWQALLDAGVRPCGLGARDTLRLEAGMNLYGSDMNESVSPLVSNMAWTVVLTGDRDFVGKSALSRESQRGPAQQLVGLVLEDRGVLRAHYRVIVPGLGEGEITSGTFSPTLGVSIALARIPAGSVDRCEVEIRNKRLPARIVKPAFVRHGRSLIV
jgi:aminomethyltransferase